jgi:hypothetical protein
MSSFRDKADIGRYDNSVYHSGDTSGRGCGYILYEPGYVPQRGDTDEIGVLLGNVKFENNNANWE